MSSSTITILFFIISHTCLSQDIIGDWKIERSIDISKIEVVEKIDIGKRSSSEKKKKKVSFKSDGTGYYYNLSMEFNYQINDTLLIMGNRKYKVVSLTKNEMIIEDIPNLYSIGVYRHFYKRY